MDVVEELRRDSYVIPDNVRHAAADEIERLRAEVLRLIDAARGLPLQVECGRCHYMISRGTDDSYRCSCGNVEQV